MIKDDEKKKKTTIELTEEQYFYLKEKAIYLQKKRENHSIVSIIRDLIDADRHKTGVKMRKEGRHV